MAAVAQLPELKGIYYGKFKDRSPHVTSAGKMTVTGDSTSLCMKSDGRPTSPEAVRRFRASIRPDAGKMSVFHGKAYDPQLKLAAEMTHGLAISSSVKAGHLLNPFPNSLFNQSIINKRESAYASNQRAPLGRSHDQDTGLPDGLNPVEFTFGNTTQKDGYAGELINPNKTWPQVKQEAVKGHDLYRRTHHDYDPGEQCNRKYAQLHFDPVGKFGIPTPHDNSGFHVRNTMHWFTEKQNVRSTPLVSKRVDDFRERTQPQLGKVHDPLKDTLTVGADHTFGILIKPDEYGVGDLLHQRAPGNYLRGKERIRGVVASIRQHLKKANFHNFNDLLSAFRFYDKDQTGKISVQDLRNVCLHFGLPAEPELVEQVMNYCDVEGKGFVNYQEFGNFLNWKDKIPFSLQEPLQNMTDESTVMNGRPKPHSADDHLHKLRKQIDDAIGQHRTSSAMVSATVGKYNTNNYRMYGVPTVRIDKAAPRLRRIHDTTNYGDLSQAYGLLTPSIFSHHGIYEHDTLKPRPRDEIYQIFKNIGLQMTLDDFDRVHQLASRNSPGGLVSVETFRNILDTVQAFEFETKGI